MRHILFKIFIALCCLLPKTAWGDAVSVSTVRTENMTNPIGIDTTSPYFGWRLESEKREVLQTAYRILVASSKELLDQDKGDLWDSGKVLSSSSVHIKYEGTKLKSNQYGWWKVKSFTNKGETKWSEVAFFSVGLINEVNWRGQWVGLDKAAPGDSETKWSRLSSRYLRKEFKLKNGIKRATVHIAGMGMYELFVNGNRVGEQVLAPVPTDYRKTIVYNSFDVTGLLTENNAIGVTLGNGRFYTMRQNFKPYKTPTFGYPKMRLNLIVEYNDGSKETVASDISWKLTTDGPIRSNNEYDGEEYDARKEMSGWNNIGFDDSSWQPAQRVSIPTGTLRGAMTPNMKVVMNLKPISITKIGEKYIIDMGQNMAGWVRMTIRNAAAGDSIKLRFAEILQPNGELYVSNLRDALVTDKYISNGKDNGNSWSPRFVYHGFSYVEVRGYNNPDIKDFIGEVVSDEMENLGTFTCSDDVLNTVYRNAWWGILDNYKGMPVDCPQRNERQPWLGDRVMGCWGESFLFDNSNLYAKWANDICEAQREDGCIPDVAPAYWNYYSDNMTWPAALPMACDMVYTHFGNVEPIRKHYSNIKKWLEYMRENYMNADYIVTKDKYGDWCVPPETLDLIHSKDPARKTDGNLIATAYYVKMLQTMHRFAEILGYKEDMEEFKNLDHKVKNAFNKKFLTIKRGTSEMPGHILYPDSIFYGNNTVTANILPLAFGLVPEEYREEVVKNVAKKIMIDKKGSNYIGNISCGVIGMQWLMKNLSKYGLADIAWMLATNDTYPSYGYMAKNVATTIWELWNGNTANPEMNSGNHVMLLGDLLKWCYENLGGVAPDRKNIAFKHIIMKPDFDIQNLYNVNVSYITPYGKVISKWEKSLQQLTWEVTIPANTTAELHMPDGKIEKIGSGSYKFNVAIPSKSKYIVKDEFLYKKSSFPECHGATIVELKNGDLVASYFGGTKERNPDCCIWVSRKPKGATEWTAPIIAGDGVFSLSDPNISIAGVSGINEKTTLATAGPIGVNFKGDINKARRKACWNPVLFQIPGGDLLLFYKIGSSVGDWTGWLVRSKDGGKTWSQREALPKGFLGPIKNKPELIDGRIICPSSTEGKMGWRLHFEISDDMGKTWKMVGPLDAEINLPTISRKAGATNNDDQEGGEAIQGKEMKPIYAIQPSILRHKDGRIQVLARTRNAKLATSWSSDNGDSWSKVTLTDLPNNNSGTDAVTMKDGRHVLIYNNFETLPGTPKGLRTPLSIALSEDGIHWNHMITLEDSPISQYSYPSIIQGKNGKLHAVYTWRRQLIKYMEIDLDK